MNKPDDRIKKVSLNDDADLDPKIYLVVNNQKFQRTGLDTYYAKPESTPGAASVSSPCSCNPVVGTYCSCNMVCTCNPQCSCEGYTSCSCEGYSSGGGGGSYCSCVPVH